MQCYYKVYKTLLRESKLDLNKWLIILLSCMGKLNRIKKAIFSKLIWGFKIFPIKILYFAEIVTSWGCDLYGHPNYLHTTFFKK